MISLVREAEALVAPGLRALHVEPALGTWKGAPVELHTRAYEGGPFRFARFIELTGAGLYIGNVLCLPRRDVLLPIFGADVVQVSPSVMVAADLSPVADCDLRALDDRPPLPGGGELPSWAQRVFSKHALYTRVPDASVAREAFLRFPQVLMSLKPQPGDSSAAQRAYCEAHLADDKGLGMLARMFGDAWAGRFLRDVMFPV